MTIAPPARGHALLPPSDCWPEVCARSAGVAASFEKLDTDVEAMREALERIALQ